MEDRAHLHAHLKRLKMPGLAAALEQRLREARENDLGYLEFLSLLIDDEMNSRENSMLAKRLKAAG